MGDAGLLAAAARLVGDGSRAGGLASAELRFQRCGQCGYLRHPVAAVCPECLSASFEWQRDSGEGTVWSVCVYHRAFDPAFEDALPYNVVLVELDSGPRLISNVLGLGDRQPHVGMRVIADVREVTAGTHLVYFSPHEVARRP